MVFPLDRRVELSIPFDVDGSQVVARARTELARELAAEGLKPTYRSDDTICFRRQQLGWIWTHELKLYVTDGTIWISADRGCLRVHLHMRFHKQLAISTAFVGFLLLVSILGADPSTSAVSIQVVAFGVLWLAFPVSSYFHATSELRRLIQRSASVVCGSAVSDAGIKSQTS